jgi:hypothetical protein
MIMDAIANFMPDYAGHGRSWIVSGSGVASVAERFARSDVVKKLQQRLLFSGLHGLYSRASLAENDRQTSGVATPDGGDPRS